MPNEHNATVFMQSTQNVVYIVFSKDKQNFAIHWEDGTITEYKYEFLRFLKGD